MDWKPKKGKEWDIRGNEGKVVECGGELFGNGFELLIWEEVIVLLGGDIDDGLVGIGLDVEVEVGGWEGVIVVDDASFIIVIIVMFTAAMGISQQLQSIAEKVREFGLVTRVETNQGLDQIVVKAVWEVIGVENEKGLSDCNPALLWKCGVVLGVGWLDKVILHGMRQG